MTRTLLVANRGEIAIRVLRAGAELGWRWTPVDAAGEQLDLGTPIDATPEESKGRCYLDAGGLSPDARAHRDLLASVLRSAGLVNYPTEWWHWSFGDRYWALLTGADAAAYGPVEVSRSAA